jgi:phage shock protein A
MARQISMEAGLAACREHMGELTYQVALLRAQLTEAEAEVASLKAAAELALSDEVGLGHGGFHDAHRGAGELAQGGHQQAGQTV